MNRERLAKASEEHDAAYFYDLLHELLSIKELGIFELAGVSELVWLKVLKKFPDRHQWKGKTIQWMLKNTPF